VWKQRPEETRERLRQSDKLRYTRPEKTQLFRATKHVYSFFFVFPECTAVPLMSSLRISDVLEDCFQGCALTWSSLIERPPSNRSSTSVDSAGFLCFCQIIKSYGPFPYEKSFAKRSKGACENWPIASPNLEFSLKSIKSFQAKYNIP
jgi:hypothetical protein